MHSEALSIPNLAIRDLARLIRQKKISSEELAQFHLKRIEDFNSAVNALCLVNSKQALSLAGEYSQEARSGTYRGRLHGVFFTAKDSTDVEGLPTGHGSKHGIVANAPHSATIVKRLQDEGAICIGKGNMAEYGKSYYTENPVFGRSLNPFDIRRTPGGSSGGDAAALACDFASFSVVSDSGGSIRVPANFSGLFGLYPTRGLISDGNMSSPPHAVSALFRRNGFLARNLSDLEVLVSVVSGADPADPYSVSPPPTAIDQQFNHKRFVYFSTMNGAECDPEISAHLHKTVKKLQDLGYTAEERCPAEFAAAFEVFIILAAQASLQLEDLLCEARGNPRDLSTEGRIIQNLRHRVSTELPTLTSQSVLRCWAAVDTLRFQAQRLWENVDFVLSPVTATLPPAHETSNYIVGSQTLLSQQVFQFASCVNVLGLPAIAFPTGLSKTNLPVGLQIIGPQFSEYALIRTLKSIGASSCLSPDLNALIGKKSN